MKQKFERRKFSECNLNDQFFMSLKEDYPEFEKWFIEKSLEGEEAFTFEDETGLCAFLSFKDLEEEEIRLKDRILPKKKRMKIRTFKLELRHQGRRLGEGAIGIALWKWQESNTDEIYLTVFDSHYDLINLIERYGFVRAGELENNINTNKKELVYLKNKNCIDYSTPYKAFPYINPNFIKAGMLPIKADYHDRLLPYSELKNTQQEFWDEAAGNGITKVYVGSPRNIECIKVGEPVFFYRKYTGDEKPTYKSCITSYGTITNVYIIKSKSDCLKTKEEFLKICGNKTIFSKYELNNAYDKSPNLVVFEFIYNGFFGKGHNVIHKELKTLGLFNVYPYDINYSKDDFKKILELGGQNVQNIIID
jgi:hypothetical protein